MTRTFHDDFLAELKAVDDFMAQRRDDVAYVRREDPDVRRLMESVAFFATRTRQVASDQLRRSVMQLARGYLDDFLTPQPARGLVQAFPNGLAEKAPLAAGTQLRVTTGEKDLGLFSTMTDVVLRPLQLDLAQVRRLAGGYRLAVRILAPRAVVKLDEWLALFISHRNDYRASRTFQYLLRAHLLPGGVSVFYDRVPDPLHVGAPCEVRFGGAPAVDGPVGTGSRIEQVRTFFHFPARELYVHVKLPPPAPPRAWRQAWLCFDLDAEWPEELQVEKDVFRLFVVPVENLVREGALPIKADGTRSHFPIAPVRAEADLALHSVLGVYQEGPAGREPILPLNLASGDTSYDLDQLDDDLERFAPHLLLRLPDAFALPRLISVDARWHQPWFENAAAGRLAVELQTKHIDGVDLRFLGVLTPHRPNTLWRDPAAMMQVLSRRASRVLTRRDLTVLMALLGADQDSYHGGLDGELVRVETVEEPADLRRGAGLRQVYRITIGEVDDDRAALLDDYLRCVETVLDAWSASPVRVERLRRIAGAGQLSGGGR